MSVRARTVTDPLNMDPRTHNTCRDKNMNQATHNIFTRFTSSVRGLKEKAQVAVIGMEKVGSNKQKHNYITCLCLEVMYITHNNNNIVPLK